MYQCSEIQSALEFFATPQSFRERSLESVNRLTEFGTFPLLAPNASEKETVPDVKEKRLLHLIFIATQSPN